MRRGQSLIALAVALAVGGWLLASRPARQPVPSQQPAALRTVTQQPGTVPARLADGTRYTPVFYADATTSVGTVPTTDGSAERLMLWSAGAERELRRIPQARYPQFLGFTVADGMLYWAESTATPEGPYETRLWRAGLTGTTPAASLTADTGAAVFFDSQFDLVVADGRLHWIAAPPDESEQTELRSVALAGGTVTVERFPGRYRWTTWPWLQSADQQGGPLRLVNKATGERRTVTTSSAETASCTPAWCRSLVQTPDGNNLLDVMRPDGSERRRIPGDVNAVTVDVGLVDRFELVTDLDGQKLRLLAYDLRSGALTVLATDVGVVTARGCVVWWSPTPRDPETWYALDLRTLT
ncbi:hypothetical protein GCM10010399_28840 [Dactylosporangium fulvum]|uniref:Uncharacterized protein n=1 Tax=Dactylosporangium fulvum TaxID=53359 RepID=A0ABY5WC45_9ACTN|nr:hypothetical protein [Dactylosporangium fulvum]UWP86248.1 hypothetical protein Dfulv_19190 [Dactylosporangium fulvum]